MIDEMNDDIATFLKKHHVLTLCVSDTDGLPWASNAFYALDENAAAFYIVSHLKTRHAQAMQINPHVSGTVCNTPRVFEKIQGIQFQAIATRLQGNAAQQAYALFYQAFPLAQAMPAPIWSINLQTIKMTNNLLGFAHKTLWRRSNI